MSFHRESSCLQGVRTLHVFPCYKNSKRTRYLSLFSSRLSTPQTSISLSKHFLTNPPWAHVTSLASPLVFVHRKPLSLSQCIFWQTHPEQQKNNHTYKNIVVRNPWWFRKHAESACWRMSILGVGCDSFFSQWFFSFREKNIKVLLKK